MTSVYQGYERKSGIVSAIFTFLFCVLFVLLCIFVKFERKPVYKEIKIHLASAPSQSVEKTVSQTEEPSVREEVPVVQESPVVQEVVTPPPAPKVEIPAPAVKETAPAPKKTETKPAEKTKTESPKPKPSQIAKTESQAKEVVQPKIKKSVEELMAEQASKKKSTEWNDNMFDDSGVSSSSSGTSNVKKVESSNNEFSGSAATGDTSKTNAPVSSSTSGNRIAQTDTTSATQSKLADVMNATFQTTVAEGVKSKTNVKASQNNGHTSLVMNDGAVRELLQPSKPVISISEESASLITTTRTVKISFQVLSNGRVPVSGIQFSPASLLPMEVQSEIREQISTWLFSADPSGANATASFEYTIEVR